VNPRSLGIEVVGVELVGASFPPRMQTPQLTKSPEYGDLHCSSARSPVNSPTSANPRVSHRTTCQRIPRTAGPSPTRSLSMQIVSTVSPATARAPSAAWYRAIRIAISLSPLLAVHFALVAIPFVEFTIWSVAAVLVVTRISGLGVTVGLHRYFSHRSFKTSRGFQFLLGCAGCTALQKGPLWWAIHHRLHHRHSDTRDDPHSPVVDGFLHGHCGWLFARDLMHPDRALVRDLAKYPELVWLDRLWMIPGLLLAAACYAFLGLNGLIFGYCLGVVLIFQITFAVNSIGHLIGPQRFDTGDGSRNNHLLGYLAMGDGWHNNHHRAPSSARHGFAWYELDMSYLFIRLLVFLRLAWGVKQPPASAMGGDPVGREQELVLPIGQ
jgi:stearoyl-CoA desaturase (delta-9 desaturase)